MKFSLVKFKKILKKYNLSKHNSKRNLMNDGILDSMEIVDIISEFEKTFKIKIKNEIFLDKNFGSIDSFIKVIKLKLNENKNRSKKR